MTKKQDKVTINDTEYLIADLMENQKYMVNQIRRLEMKIDDAQIELDQLRAAYDAFARMLIESVETPSQEDTSEDAPGE